MNWHGRRETSTASRPINRSAFSHSSSQATPQFSTALEKTAALFHRLSSNVLTAAFTLPTHARFELVSAILDIGPRDGELDLVVLRLPLGLVVQKYDGVGAL